MGELLSGRCVGLTSDDLVGFQFFVRWYLFWPASFVVSQQFNGRFILQCFLFCFVLFCTRLFVRSLARVLFRSFLCFLARLFCRYFGHACIGLTFLC